MMITSVEASPAQGSNTNDALVVLRTDAELQGIGAITMGDQLGHAVELPPAISGMLVGRDPFDLQALVADAAARPGATRMESAFLAAAGTAMADIASQRLGVPIHQLLGGRVRDRVRVCAIDWADSALDAGSIIAKARRVAELGFTALRVDPFRAPSISLDEAVALVARVREALPDSVDVVVGTSEAIDLAEVWTLADQLSPLEPIWLESTLRSLPADFPPQIEGQGWMPLAAGRDTPQEVIQQLAMRGLVDHVVVDIGRVGGILEARRIAALAEVYHIGIIPTSTGLASFAAAIHLAAVIPNLTMVEVPAGLSPIEDGTVAVDLRPGLGSGDARAVTMEVA